MIELTPVNESNWHECAELQVCDDQRDLICTNDRALAEAGFRSDIRALAIMLDGHVIGLVTLVETSSEVEVHRFMISCAYQQKGYGQQALTKILAAIEAGGVRSVTIRFLHWNDRAERLYKRVGFRDTGLLEDSEKVFTLSRDIG
jgi:diamine N-acetyltransferase